MRPDADQLFLIYQLWKDAVDQIADVDGLYPTFVANIAPASAATVAKTNGVGDTWGLDDSEPFMCKAPLPSTSSSTRAPLLPSPHLQDFFRIFKMSLMENRVAN